MKTKKSLIKIEKMHEVRKINREMETLRFVIIKKSKYDCYMNDDYTSLICEFLLSKLSQLSNKLNDLYELIDCEKFKDFNSLISDFDYDLCRIELQLSDIDDDAQIIKTSMLLDNRYQIILLTNFINELRDSLTDKRYRFPRCKHFDYPVTHLLDTFWGEFPVCDKCVEFLSHYNTKVLFDLLGECLTKMPVTFH